MYDFNIGDRVVVVVPYTSTQINNIFGEVGTVLYSISGHYCIEFDNNVGGHSGILGDFTGGKHGHCYYILPQHIEKVNGARNIKQKIEANCKYLYT